MDYMQWWRENRARVREEVARDPSFSYLAANPPQPPGVADGWASERGKSDLCEVFKGPLRKCRHPRLYTTGPRRGQCTVCHQQTRPACG